MTRKHRYEGVRQVRRILRQLPPEATEHMASVMKRFGRKFLVAMHLYVPIKTGALRRGLSVKFLRRTLRLRVGFVGKRINRRLYYGRIVQGGRKAQTVIVKRRRGSKQPYSYRVKERAAKPFVRGTPAMRSVHEQLQKTLSVFWNDVLRKVSGGHNG